MPVVAAVGHRPGVGRDTHAGPKAGGDGGAIALDAQGNAAFPFNTEGMYRGWIGADGTAHVAIFKDEAL
ncbi:hypothetical protein ASJ34_15185 [Xanthomonas campestris pv. campestris]|nr:hypothetical protein ASJ34_15185 [Xanthomonas campestris pv. campestris]